MGTVWTSWARFSAVTTTDGPASSIAGLVAGRDSYVVSSQLVCPQTRQAQLLKELAVTVFAGVRGREQFWSVEDRIGAGEEAQSLGFRAHTLTAGAQPHYRSRHGQPGGGDGPHELDAVDLLAPGDRRALDLD